MKTSQKKVVIICSGTKDGLRSLYEFANHKSNTNVIVTCVPHRFDLQPSSCVNKEFETFNEKLQKEMKTFSLVHVCSMSTNRNNFTMHGVRLNSQGKHWIANKWASIITPIISKSGVIYFTPFLGWKRVIIVMMNINIGKS